MLAAMTLRRTDTIARWGTCIIVAVSMLLSGCAFKGLLPQDNKIENKDAPWQAKAVDMRLQPSTRYLDEIGHTIIDVRVELIDEMDDPIKESGEYRFELSTMPRSTEVAAGRLLYAWSLIPVVTIEQHQLHYDPIARAYRFKLELDRLPPKMMALKLVAQFVAADGHRLAAEVKLER